MVGKPESAFFLAALASIDESLIPQQAVMIGDDVRDDILGAINAGMRGILVKTGKYRRGFLSFVVLFLFHVFIMLCEDM